MLARELLSYSIDELWDTLVPTTYELTFDDNITITCKHKEILYSSYFWTLHKEYPITPLYYRHHVASILKGESLNTSTHIRLLENIYWDVVDAYNLTTPTLRYNLTKRLFQITNYLYNDLIKRLEPYVVSIDILDFIKTIESKEVKEQLNKLQPNEVSLREVNNNVLNLIKNSPELKNNALSKALKSKVINQHQLLQCVVARGYASEVDDSHLPTPIMRSLVQGYRTIYEVAAESRSAAKSLYFQDAQIKDTSYLARRLQLMCMIVERLIYTDCGSEDYLIWRVRDKETENGHVIYPGDLEFLEGKYYLDEVTNTLRVINKKDSHLVNKIIKIRTVLGCKLHDPHEVCSVCFGTMSDNIIPGANLGHVVTCNVTQVIIQSVLSIKHLDMVSFSDNIKLSSIGHRFLRISNKGDYLFAVPQQKNKRLYLTVTANEAFGLTDIDLYENADDILPNRISSLTVLEFMVEDIDDVKSEIQIHPINISYQGKKCFFSKEFLQYLKIHRWESSNKLTYIFNLDKWDYSKPIISVPLKDYSFAKHANDISKIIESSMENITERIKPNSPKSTLVELFELVNSKLSINIACLEIIIYAIICKDIANDKYGITHDTETAGLGITNLIIKNRSLSVAYAYESQHDVINKPISFFKLDRNDHIVDAFFLPDQVIKYK